MPPSFVQYGRTQRHVKKRRAQGGKIRCLWMVKRDLECPNKAQRGSYCEIVPIVLGKAEHPIFVGGSTCGDAQRRRLFLRHACFSPTKKNPIGRGARPHGFLCPFLAAVRQSGGGLSVPALSTVSACAISKTSPLSFSRAYFYALGQAAYYGDERTHPTQLWLPVIFI